MTYPTSIQYLADAVARELDRPLAVELADEAVHPVPDSGAERFAITVDDGAIRLRAGGRRGLVYGLHELRAQALTGAVVDVERAPELPVRSLCFFPHNRQIEAPWIHERAHWQAWFELMAEARLNMFAFTFAHQTAYLAPPYPYLLQVPGWERVSTPGWGDDDRRRYLETLRMIGELAAEFGTTFVLGIWQQHALDNPDNGVRGLSYDDLFDYCPAALAALLAEVPQIGGVQFRMNSESGIAEDDQARFFGPMFEVLREAGRPLWIDLRAKGLRPETIADARQRGLELVVSTKFWCEHMGLPYHQARTNPLDAAQYRRYGYWDLLRRDRPYRMLWRLWTVGTQRVLPWGSPAYAAAFATACHEGDGLGFEVCAPESNKGYRNHPGGAWSVIADPACRVGRWDFERHWPFFLAFGLAGYGDGNLLWQSAFQRRFGTAAEPLRQALEAASEILPLVTAAHCASASTFGSWSELYTGGLTDTYARIGTGDVARLQSIHDYVEALFSGEWDGRLRPPAVAARLEAMADAALSALDAVSDPGHEAAQLAVGIRVVALLGRYHARRHRSAIHWLLFRRTGDADHLTATIDTFRAALDCWREVVGLTAGRFHAHMVFNQPGRQTGHWQDEVPWLEVDLERLEAIARLWRRVVAGAPLPPEPNTPWYQVEHVAELRDGTVHHRPGNCLPAEAPAYPLYGLPPLYLMQHPAAAVRDARSSPDFGRPIPAPPPSGPLPAIAFEPPAAWPAGRDLPVAAEVTADSPLRVVRLHARRRHQAEDWHLLPMTQGHNGRWHATVPGGLLGAEYDFQLAVEAVDTLGRGAIHPAIEEGRAACTIRVS